MNVAIRKRAKPGEISQNGLKNQAYRDRMTAAFNSLRIALWADPSEQWRSEKLYIIDGAIKVIQQNVGGISKASRDSSKGNGSNIDQNRSVASGHKAILQEIDKLKKLLLEHCKEANARMTVPALLNTAAEFIKSFNKVNPLQLSGSGTGSSSSTSVTNTPSSVLSPTYSLDIAPFHRSGDPTIARVDPSALTSGAHLINPNVSTSSTTPITSSTSSVNRDNSRFYKSGFFRPWE